MLMLLSFITQQVVVGGHWTLEKLTKLCKQIRSGESLLFEFLPLTCYKICQFVSFSPVRASFVEAHGFITC